MKLEIIIIIILAGLPFASEEIHQIADGSIGYKALSSSATQNRLREAAQYYTQKKKASRIGIFDMAYPRDSTEYNIMNGFGILWVTVLTRDTNEFPIEVVLKGQDEEQIVLDPLHLFRLTETDRKISRSLGKYRLDGIYLVPLISDAQGAMLFVDFAIPEKGFDLGTMESIFPPALGVLYDEVMDIPEKSIADVMVVREYPLLKTIIEDLTTVEK